MCKPKTQLEPTHLLGEGSWWRPACVHEHVISVKESVSNVRPHSCCPLWTCIHVFCYADVQCVFYGASSALCVCVRECNSVQQQIYGHGSVHSNDVRLSHESPRPVMNSDGPRERQRKKRKRRKVKRRSRSLAEERRQEQLECDWTTNKKNKKRMKGIMRK